MATKPKLTPTFNDKAKELNITPPHEPLGGEQWLPVGNIIWKEQTVNPADEPQQTEKPNPLKVALVGTAPSSRMMAPYNDPSWTIWGCSPGNMGIMPRVDAWFEIHGNLLWPENRHYGEPYLNWLNQQQFPVYMQSQQWVPRAMTIPVKELVAEFGPYFFT